MMYVNRQQIKQLSTRCELRGEEGMNSVHILQMDLLKVAEHIDDIVNTCE